MYCKNQTSFKYLHRIIESQNGRGWKGSYGSCSSHPPAMGSGPFHQTWVLKAPSNLTLNTTREGAATPSLGNLVQGLTTLRGKNFFLLSNLNLAFFSLKPLLPALSPNALVKNPSPALSQGTSDTGRLL